MGGCPGEVINPNDGNDCFGHGTHVASLAAGSNYGVAKDAAIVNLRVTNCFNRGFVSDWIAAVNYMASDHANLHPGEAAVANMSLEADGVDETLDLAVLNASVYFGITVVVCAGNHAIDACLRSPSRAGNPASFTAQQNPTGASAITVGATERFDNVAPYSNYGPCVDIFAPGTDVTALGPSGTGETGWWGTSFAAPLVAGVAAIHMQRYNMPNNPAAIQGMIRDNSTPNVLTSMPPNTPNLLLWNGILTKYHACCTYP